jgi:hypothetical protein
MTDAVAVTPKAKKAETVIESVIMTDERIVEFPGKKKLQKESFEDADGTLRVRLDFRNGETRTFVIPKTLIPKSALHGMEQKLGDQIAGEDDIDDCVLAVDNLIDQLNAGEWTSRKEGDGMSGTSVLLKAMVEVTGKPVDALRAWLKPKTQAQKIALRDSAKFRDVVARLEAEKASKKAKVDISGELAELDTL